jgi:hypothetical protein
LKFFVGQNFCSHEYFVRPRFAQQMLRRCTEFSDSLSARERKSSADSPRRISNKARKTASMSSCRLIAAVHPAEKALSWDSREGSDRGSQTPHQAIVFTIEFVASRLAGAPPAAHGGGTDCVFFAQHLPENGTWSL